MANDDKKPKVRKVPGSAKASLSVDLRAFILYATRISVQPRLPNDAAARAMAKSCRELVLAFDDTLEEEATEAEIRAEKQDRELELD